MCWRRCVDMWSRVLNDKHAELVHVYGFTGSGVSETEIRDNLWQSCRRRQPKKTREKTPTSKLSEALLDLG